MTQEAGVLVLTVGRIHLIAGREHKCSIRENLVLFHNIQCLVPAIRIVHNGVGRTAAAGTDLRVSNKDKGKFAAAICSKGVDIRRDTGVDQLVGIGGIGLQTGHRGLITVIIELLAFVSGGGESPGIFGHSAIHQLSLLCQLDRAGPGGIAVPGDVHFGFVSADGQAHIGLIILDTLLHLVDGEGIHQFHGINVVGVDRKGSIGNADRRKAGGLSHALNRNAGMCSRTHGILTIAGRAACYIQDALRVSDRNGNVILIVGIIQVFFNVIHTVEQITAGIHMVMTGEYHINVQFFKDGHKGGAQIQTVKLTTADHGVKGVVQCSHFPLDVHACGLGFRDGLLHEELVLRGRLVVGVQDHKQGIVIHKVRIAAAVGHTIAGGLVGRLIMFLILLLVVMVADHRGKGQASELLKVEQRVVLHFTVGNIDLITSTEHERRIEAIYFR